MYLMNNPCMLLSLLDYMYINIGNRNGLPTETAVWANVGEEGKKRSAVDLLPSTPLLITLKCP